LSTNAGSIAVTARTDPDALLAYNEYWHRADPWAHSPSAKQLVSGTVVVGDQLIQHATLKQTAYYNEFGRRHDIVRCIAVMIEVGPHAFSCLSINASEKREVFNEHDQTLLRALMGPLQRALALHRRLGVAEVLTSNLTSVVDRLPHGVLLLSSSGHVLLANRAAEEILRLKDGLLIEHKELHAASRDGTSRLRNAIGIAVRISSGELIHGETALLLERPSGKRPLSVLAAPLPKRHAMLGIEAAAVVVFVTDPDRKPTTQAATLRAMFGLTRGEAQLVLVLLEGASVQQAAERLELATDTVRKQLKSIFEKTDTHRQAELIRRVLMSTLPHYV
jgi:DNA-binding CsgD family transcriptional regulator